MAAEPLDHLRPYLGLPSEEVMSCVDGLVENHHYVDHRDVTTNAVREAIQVDESLADMSEDDDLYDELDRRGLSSLEDLNLYSDLDNGMRGAVLAIALAGAVPYSSCSGAEGHSEQFPLIAFWSDEAHAPAILSAASSAGLEITPLEPCMEYVAGLMVSAKDHSEIPRMTVFAKCLMGSVAVNID